MKTRPLGNTAFDMIVSESFIRDGAKNDVMVIGNGYYDPDGFSADAMVKAYREVFRRNDALRMRLVKQGLFLRYYIPEYYDPTVRFHELKGGREAFRAECRTDSTPHIDKMDEELCRADIYTCSDGTGGIILWQHHICSDGYTLINLIHDQLSGFYTAYKNGEEPAPPRHLYSHNDYIDKRREQLHKHGLRDYFGILKDTWRYLFRFTVPVKNDPQIKPQVQHRFILGAEEYEALRALCGDLKVSVPCVLGSLLSMIVLRRTGKRIFKIDFMSNGRTNFALKNTAGDLTSSIPVIMNIDQKKSAAQCIRDTYKCFLKNASRFAFSSLLIYSTIDAVLCFCSLTVPWKNRWCQLNYYKFGENKNAALESFPIDERTDFMNLYLEFFDVENGLSVFFQHAESILNETQGKEVLDYFFRFLKEIAKDPERPLEEIFKILD